MNSQLLPLFGCMLSAGGFPTQVFICDLKGEKTMRDIVLSEGRDMWDCTPRCLTTELPQFMLWALSMTEIQLLKFAKGDRIPQDNNVFQCYTCRDWDWFVKFYYHQLNSFAKLWICYFTVIAWFQTLVEVENMRHFFVLQVEKEESPSSSGSLSWHLFTINV